MNSSRRNGPTRTGRKRAPHWEVSSAARSDRRSRGRIQGGPAAQSAIRDRGGQSDRPLPAAGRDGEGEEVLRNAIAVSPRDAAAHYALGLVLTRLKKPDALAAFARTTELEPGNARYLYVYAVALHSGGRGDEAMTLLKRGLAKHPTTATSYRRWSRSTVGRKRGCGARIRRAAGTISAGRPAFVRPDPRASAAGAETVRELKFTVASVSFSIAAAMSGTSSHSVGGVRALDTMPPRRASSARDRVRLSRVHRSDGPAGAVERQGFGRHILGCAALLRRGDIEVPPSAIAIAHTDS